MTRILNIPTQYWTNCSKKTDELKSIVASLTLGAILGGIQSLKIDIHTVNLSLHGLGFLAHWRVENIAFHIKLSPSSVLAIYL